MTRAGHLARRFSGSLSRRPPSAADESWARGYLLEGEQVLWARMDVVDRRHAVAVARRFAAAGEWTREEMAGALLHDVGKIESNLGTVARVMATLIGPRGRRFRHYHDHEEIGAALLQDVGSSPTTVELVRGQGRAADALRSADEV